MAWIKLDLRSIKGFKIGSHPYRVILPYKFEERDDIGAQIVYESGEVRVSDADVVGVGRLPSMILRSIIHEILHGIDRIYSLGMFEDDEGEKKVNLLAQAITSFLIENDIVEVTYAKEKMD